MHTSVRSAARAVLVFAMMAIIVPGALSLTALISKPANAADVSSCAVINDADARAFCLARARKDPGMCYAVQRPELRAQCLAEVRK